MTWTSILSGYFVSMLVGGLLIFIVWKLMWGIASKDDANNPLKTPDLLAFIQGAVERGLYTSCIVLGRPDGIAVWLAFKALMRVRILQDDPRHIPGTAIYLVGTALSVAFGVIGGLIATKTSSLR